MNNLLKKVAVSVSTVATVASMGLMPMVAKAAAPGEVYKTPDGTVWFITTDMQKRPFTSAGAFLSYGFLSFSQVKDADASVTALPTGSFIAPADGKIFCASETKGSDVKGECSLVTGGMKAAFTSAAVFTGQGFSFSRAINGDSSFLSKTSNIDSSSAGHLPGVLVNNSGTVQMVVSGGLWGVPSMDVFNSWGYSFSDVVPANAADKALSQVGVIPARQAGQLVPTGTTTPTPTGAYTASVSSDSPAASTLVAEQATADLAHFTVMGSGTVTSLKFKRTGVSSDSTLSNVYLFEGATRLTDAASVSSGYITFAGLNWTVSGSRMVAVKSDILTGTSGQTIGVQLVAVNGTDLGVMPTGATHTIASASLATVAVGAPTASGATDPGTDINVWQSTFTVGVRDVTFNRIALRQVSNIVSSDVKNFRLMVDGVQISSQSALDANGYVTFSGFTKTLKTGTPVIKVIADVIGGSARSIQMSLRNKADIGVSDSQYNVNVSASGTFPASPTAISINSGTVSVTKTTDSTSGNVTNNASNVVLGKWTVTAYGEPVKIENLAFAVDWSGADADLTLRNGKVMIGGTQYGSTTGLAAAGAATAAATFTTNFTVNPGSPVVVELISDIYDEEAAGNELAVDDTIQAYMIDNDVSNGTRQVSLTTLDVPTTTDVGANSLTVKEGSLNLAALASYPTQTTVAPQTNYKLGAWTLTGSSTEDFNITSLSLDIDSVTNATFSAADLSDIYIKYGSSNTSIKPTPTAADNDWSVSFTLAKNQVMNIELYGNIGAAANITDADSVKSDLTVTGTGVQSSASAGAGATDKDGQTIIKNSGSFATSKDASSPATKLVDDSGTVEVAKYRIDTTYDSYTLTEVDINLSSATAVTSIVLKDGGTTLGTLPAATSVLFAGLNVLVPANSSKVLTVELVMSTVGVGAGTSGSNVTVTLDSIKHRATSSGTEATDTNDRAGNVMYAYKALPTVTAETLPSTALTAGSKTIAKFSVNTNGTGSIAWKQVLIDIAKIAAPTITSPTLWDVTGGGNTQITAAAVFQNDTNTDAACNASDTVCELLISVGTNADDNVEEQVNGTKTYEVRATIGGTLADGNYITTTIASNLAHVSSAAYTGVDNDTTVDDSTFVWSDMSAAAHDTGTLDWVNENLLKNLPTVTQTLTASL